MASADHLTLTHRAFSLPTADLEGAHLQPSTACILYKSQIRPDPDKSRSLTKRVSLLFVAADLEGAHLLQSNERIDGMYVYVAPPSIGTLGQRFAGRLKEVDSTIAKRLAWAAAEMERSGNKAIIDYVVPNTTLDAAYLGIKEAIATLHPLVRNRLFGLPGYMLDYADLISPNLMEKPFLKPVLISGPSIGDRKAMMDMLVREFPDVFAFPVLHTTRAAKEPANYRADLEPETFEPEKDPLRPVPQVRGRCCYCLLAVGLVGY